MRHSPQHDRSAATVQRVLAAAEALLLEHRFRDISTAMLATQAHVSIGTLYRYFPSKDAIYLRLYESRASTCAAEMRKTLLRGASLPIEHSLRPVIATMLNLYNKNQAVLIGLPEQAPELFLPLQLLTVDNLVEHASRHYLEAQGARLAGKTNDACVYFLIHNSLVENIRRFVRQPRPVIRRKAFLDEAAELVRCYIQHRATTATEPKHR